MFNHVSFYVSISFLEQDQSDHITLVDTQFLQIKKRSSSIDMQSIL